MGEIEWSEVADRLAPAPIYWLHTTGPTGNPEASPVWGVVVAEHFHFYTTRSTLKARNLACDSRVVAHLESGSDVVIVHGHALDVGHPMDHPVLLRTFESKYSRPDEVPFLPSSDPAFDVMYMVEPRRALVWSLPDSEASTRRWTAR